MAAQFEHHRLVLVPLTPIHIGGGEEARLRPEDYRLHGGHAERVDVRAVLARLPEAERAAWLRDMGRVTADVAPKVIRDVVARLQGKATAAEVIERIPISAQSASAMDLSGDGNDRRNQIDAFFRAGGRPTLPGSSLKGALRTAWAAAMARVHGEPRLPDRREWERSGKRDRARDAARAIDELFALAGGKRAQDTDPFRDVILEDSPLPEGATRIDRIESWKRGPHSGGRPGGWAFGSVGEMHRERLRAAADGGAPPVVGLALGLRSAAVRAKAGNLAPDRRPRPDRTPDSLAALLAALESHHAPLWQSEVEAKFFAGPPGDRLRQALALFGGFRRDGDAPEAALIRLGWAGHAEAKSLAGLRRIERPQARGEGRIAAEGSTRHVVNLNGHPLPFGWALLIRAEVWAARAPAAWLAPPAPRAAPAAGPARPAVAADPRGGTALGRQLRYRKGQRVRVDGEIATLLDDVTEAMSGSDTVRVSLAGDTEVIKVSEIEDSA